jgi:surface protein
MFFVCKSLTTLDLSSFNTSNVTDMGYMFNDCESLTTLDVSSFDTSNVTNMDVMFESCKSLTTLDLSSFDVSNVRGFWHREMFWNCEDLMTIYSPRNVVVGIDFPYSGIWHLSDGTAAYYLLENLSYSVKYVKYTIEEIDANTSNTGNTEATDTGTVGSGTNTGAGTSNTTNEETEQTITKTVLTNQNSTIKLSTKAYTYDGKEKTPTVKVYDSNGKVIKKDYYTVTYKNNTKVGKATLTIKFKGKYTGTIKATYTIRPKATLFTGTSAKSDRITLTWKKQTKQVTGYQIQYATDSKFTKNKTTILVKGTKKSSETITGLSGKTKYYFRIRTYKTVDGKKYYSAWSKQKKVTTK